MVALILFIILVIPAISEEEVNKHHLGNAYWYSVHIDEAHCILVGQIKIKSVKESTDLGKKTEYTFTVDEIVKNNLKINPNSQKISDTEFEIVREYLYNQEQAQFFRDLEKKRAEGN